MRTCLGTSARIRHEACRGFHRAVAQKDWRSTADSHSALRWLYDSRRVVKHDALSRRVAVGSKNSEIEAARLLGFLTVRKVTTALPFRSGPRQRSLRFYGL